MGSPKRSGSGPVNRFPKSEITQKIGKRSGQLIPEKCDHPKDREMDRSTDLMSSSETIDKILNEGADKARAMSVPFLKEIKRKIGFYS